MYFCILQNLMSPIKTICCYSAKSKQSQAPKPTQNWVKPEKKVVTVKRKRVRKERISSDSTSEPQQNHLYKDSTLNSSYSISSDNSDDDSEWKSPHEKSNLIGGRRRYRAVHQTRSRHKEILARNNSKKRAKDNEEPECRRQPAKSKKETSKAR